MKQFLNSKKASKTAAILFAVFGGLVAVVGILVGRLTAVAPDEISADARALLPAFTAYCVIYVVVAAVYAFLRLKMGAGMRLVVFCEKYKVVAGLFIILAGMSLVWIVPLVTAFITIQKPLVLVVIMEVIALAGIAALFMDAWQHITMLVNWLRSK